MTSALPPLARFWMICRAPLGPHSKTEPKARFTSYAAAEDEATKLATATDADFLILAPVAVIKPGDTPAQGGLF